MASPFKDADDLIFSTQKGTPVDGHNFVRRVFDPALRRAGLPKIRFHDLRHTFASLLIAQGEHPKLISEQLGHASVQITLDRYGHLLPASYDSAGERLELALFGHRLVSVSKQWPAKTRTCAAAARGPRGRVGFCHAAFSGRRRNELTALACMAS